VPTPVRPRDASEARLLQSLSIRNWEQGGESSMRLSRNTGPFLILLVAACLLASAAPADAKLKVGDQRPVWIDSARDYKGSPDGDTFLAWEKVIHEPGATYVAVHFKNFQLAPGDSLRISDEAGEQAYTLEDRGKMNAGEFWARHIKGDTAVLQLFVTNPTGAQGFVIDLVATGNRELGDDTEAICLVDDKMNAICYADSYPDEYAASRPVARLLIAGTSLCTGWLASAAGHLVTNEHCIGSAYDALNTDYEFMSEAPLCASTNCQLCWTGDIYDGANFLTSNPALDYTLVQFAGSNPAVPYGYMEIDNRDAVLNERIYMPQHPLGYAKELGIESTSDADGLCHVNSLTAAACTGATWYNDIGYYCDTEGGSSGSPVLAASNHKVIALHHCGTCLNRGVPIDLVYAEIGPYLQPGNCDADGTCEAGEDCYGCPSDCVAGGSGCGDNICDIASGESCRTCPEDCNGVLTGSPTGRYCCGDPTDCSDSRCTGGGNTCSEDPVAGYCCGDDVCEGAEDGWNCALDCGAPPVCGNSNCDAGEDSCNCPEDCGAPPAENCSDSVDNDCDDAVDCADTDCDGDPACECGLRGEICFDDAECCSNWCHKGLCK